VKSQFIRSVSAGFLCLCALTALSGCSLFDFEKLVKESQRKQDEKWRQFIEAQQQLQRKQQQHAPQQSLPDQQAAYQKAVAEQQAANVRHDQKSVITIEEQHRQAMESQQPIKVGEQIPEPFA
jgi:hypothetical protein